MQIENYKQNKYNHSLNIYASQLYLILIFVQKTVETMLCL